MRLSAIILPLSVCALFSKPAFAATYYVSPSGGTGTGLDSNANAWNFAKFNATTVPAGSIVRFKRGGIYVGAFTARSGTSSAHITYDAYSAGADPVFTGLVLLAPNSSVWTLYSGNIYYASVDVSRMQIVTIDGVMKGMARYPKTSYFPVSSHVGLTSITAPTISGIPFNPAGGEVVIKKARYLLDRHGITSRSSNTLNITSPSDFGLTSNNGITDGNGYFIQNHLGAVTQDGDWYYDVSAKRLYVHFGTGNYTAHTVYASLTQDVISAVGLSYIDFWNMDIRGANQAGANIQYSDHITFNKCTFSLSTQGIAALQGGGAISVDSCNINTIHSEGFNGYEADNATITNTTVRDIALIPGMAMSGDERANGITIHGNGFRVANCIIRKTGYCGIAMYGGGGRPVIENNIIDSFCMNRDDGGGFYTYGLSPNTYPVRIVRNNIITNGQGSIDGVSPTLASDPYAIGIYLDFYSSNVNVYNNICANNAGAGVLFNYPKNDTLANNTFYNNGFYGFHMMNLEAGTVGGLYVTNNKFIAKTPGQMLIGFEVYPNLSDLNTMGTFANNYFYRPFGSGNYIRIDDRRDNGQIITDYTLPNWKRTYSQEGGSIHSTVPITSESDFNLSYNYSPAPAALPLTGIYKDVTGASFNGRISLSGNMGAVLIYASPLNTQPASYIIRGRKVETGPVITP